MTHTPKMLFITVLSLFCASCASSETGINDPLEPMNRAIFSFNGVVDNYALVPIAKGYRLAIPAPARTGVRNFIRNIHSPINIANQLLQGDLDGTVSDTGRMLINTTVGVGGLFDVAKSFGMPYEYEDFGQTLRVWGLNDTPYLVLPLIGPGTIGDHTGFFIDSYVDPLNRYLVNTDKEGWYYGRLGLEALDTREALLDPIKSLEEGSFDFYATLRSAYEQQRQSMVNDEDPTKATPPSIPDYDDEDF